VTHRVSSQTSGTPRISRGSVSRCARLASPSSGAFAKCGTKAKFKVKPGKHKFAVHATDAAGNTGKDAKLKWKVTK
jgi:hypothetical protein